MAFRKTHKYGARRTVYGGQAYDSVAEAERASQLDVLKAAGQIAAWGRGDVVTLIPGKRNERVTYRPDFWVRGLDGAVWYEDVKGVATPVFKIKRRVLHYLLPDYDLRVFGADGELVPL